MYDVIFLADIYVPGGTNFQLAQSIKFLRSLEKRVGVIPVQLPHARGLKPINHFIREAISGGHCEVIDHAEETSRCHLFVIDNPRLIAPDLSLKTKVIAARNVILVPFPARDGNGAATFDPDQVAKTATNISSGDFIWAPWSNLVRAQMTKFYPGLPLSELNAHPIVEAANYPFWSGMRSKRKIALGRHSRPEKDKWPSGRSAFLKVYPDRAPFEVSLLGIDAPSLTAMIGAIPANYRVLPYDSVSPKDFLSGIDFFVYYHHHSWVEALGIAIVEAMAVGALCILPRYMEQNFGEAAVYASPNNVRDDLVRYHRKERDYRDQTRAARKFVQREFSTARFQAFVEEFGIVPGPPKSKPRQQKPRRYDAVYVSDYSSPKVFNYAFVEELVQHSLDGRRIAAYDLRSGAATPAPFAEHALAARGVDFIDIDQTITCDRLIINDPWRAVVHALDLSRIKSEETTCVVSYPHGELGKIQRYLARFSHSARGGVRWAPRDAFCRIWLEAFDPNLLLSSTNWQPRVSAPTLRLVEEYRRQRPITTRRVIGFLGIEQADDAKWVIGLLPSLQDDPAPILTCYGERPKQPALDPRILSTGYNGIDLVKWLAKLDTLIIVRDRLKADNLDYVVSLCQSAGIQILYRSRHNKEKANAGQALDGLDQAELRRVLLGEPIAAGAGQRSEAPKPLGTRRSGEPIIVPESLQRVNSGHVPLRHHASRPALLFVSQNGTGVGHVVRQVAIARKLSSDYDCIFLTMSQAVSFISAFGFYAEYFPSSVYSGVSHTDWLYWLRKKVDLMLDCWGVRSVVFDGNVPYASVAEAASSRRDVRSVWIRRGMWPNSEVDRKRVAAQTYFDVVVEPRDFADDYDQGPTKSLRDTVRLVPPIQLLERDEILPRAEACRILGIDPDAVNVLVQLGSGNNRDTQTLLQKISTLLAERSDHRVFNLRWPISDIPATQNGVAADLAIFPIARFYRAFDFSISAAGYNTAHEVLSYRLPTIFVPNETEGMDNQAARADFSAGRGLALSGGLAKLGANIDKMVDPNFRRRMRDRLRRLNLENGAGEAARYIDRLSRPVA